MGKGKPGSARWTVSPPRPVDSPKPGAVPPSPRPPTAQLTDSDADLPRKGALAGRVIGDKYGVTEIIGEGGMGAVYEAEHLAIGRLVAVKVLHPQNTKRKDAVQRFHHEARVAGSIGHPNICEIHDVGKLPDGTPYLVMERLFGEALSDRVAKEGALPYLDVLDILVQVLSALAAAHEKGVIHRDIKPENIFLAKRSGAPPIVKLLDFGISKVGRDEDDLHLTRTGMVMGTPYYMAPEQARGDRTIDQRIDLYAAGAVLYECLTGKRPFTAPNYNALLVQILSGDARSVRDLRPALPEAFDAIVSKAMAKDRAARFQTAGEMLAALSQLRDKLVRQSRAPSTRPPPRIPSSPEVPPASIEIPIDIGESGQYMAVSSGELMAAPSDTSPGSSEPSTHREAAIAADASDTYVDEMGDPSDPTEVGSVLEGKTPVHGAELREVRRRLAGERDVTVATAPLTDTEADEIVRRGRRDEKRGLALNALRPASAPAARARRNVPREEPPAPPPPRAPAPTDEDDAPTTFFRPGQQRPPPPDSQGRMEVLSEDDEIVEHPVTLPSPPPTTTPLSVPAVPRPGRPMKR